MKLILIGDGDQRQMYEQMAEGLNVEFKGRQPSEVARSFMHESKSTVLPSEWEETFGLTVAESMSEGSPSVVSGIGSLPQFVQDSRLGEVFKTGDANALAEAIIRLLKRDDYDEMCLACRKEAEEKYSEAQNYKLLIGVYNSICAKRYE